MTAWRAAADLEPRIRPTEVPDGVLLELAPMGSLFLAVASPPWEQLTATLTADLPSHDDAVRLRLMESFSRLQVFTLGARTAIDRRGALVVVSDRVSHLLTSEERVAWLLSLQVVANAMLSITSLVKAESRALEHDELQALFALPAS